jgi:hypothetical protein
VDGPLHMQCKVPGLTRTGVFKSVQALDLKSSDATGHTGILYKDSEQAACRQDAPPGS